MPPFARWRRLCRPFTILLDRRLLAIFLLGVSSGIPLLLVGSTLKAWLKEEGVDLSVIGLSSLVGLPFAFKFLWAPVMDRFTLPILGRRRGWICLCQVVLCLLLFGFSLFPPQGHLVWFLCLSLVTAFLSASQDIAIDAYRRDVLSDKELGLGASYAINGYRVGLLVAGALALALADHISWHKVYQVMGVTMCLMTLVTFFAPEPQFHATAPGTLKSAVLDPLLDFFRRNRISEILVFIVIFKIGDSMASDMFNPFFLDLGFSKTEIAAIAKAGAFWATILGGILGGVWILRRGILPSLWTFGILQMVSTLSFTVLARSGHVLAILGAVIVFENLCSAMATSAYVALLASLCNRKFSATQYAILSSLASVPRILFGASSGIFAKKLGWEEYFIFCALLHIPGLVLLMRRKKWESHLSPGSE